MKVRLVILLSIILIGCSVEETPTEQKEAVILTKLLKQTLVIWWKPQMQL